MTITRKQIKAIKRRKRYERAKNILRNNVSKRQAKHYRASSKGLAVVSRNWLYRLLTGKK